MNRARTHGGTKPASHDRGSSSRTPPIGRVRGRERGRALTLKEQRFVDAFLGTCGGNAKKAAIAAGYSPRSAEVTGSRMLRKAKVQQAVKERQVRETKRSILTAEQRDEHLSKLALSSAVPPATQVSAIKELNKCSGRHSIRVNVDVGEKLADIIAGSRARA